MAEFQEDILFKNVSDEDASILLEIIGKKSKRTRVWTKELRHIDPTNYKPDLILDLDDQKRYLGEQKDELENVLNEFYTKDLQKQYGVLGIRIEIKLYSVEDCGIKLISVV